MDLHYHIIEITLDNHGMIYLFKTESPDKLSKFLTLNGCCNPPSGLLGHPHTHKARCLVLFSGATVTPPILVCAHVALNIQGLSTLLWSQ